MVYSKAAEEGLSAAESATGRKGLVLELNPKPKSAAESATGRKGIHDIRVFSSVCTRMEG